MSITGGSWRPFARVGWGGKAASHFRANSTNFRANSTNFPIAANFTSTVRMQGATVNLALTGITRDNTGAVLGTCVTELLQSGGDILTQSTISDASGNFSFSNPGSGPFFIRSYKDGAPNLAGVTDRNLIAV